MIRTRRSVVATATALMIAAGLVACTAIDDSAPQTPAPATYAASGLSPLDQMLWGDPDDVADTEKKYQETIQQCMKDQGFTYEVVEVTPPEGTLGLRAQPTRKWVEEHGSGNIERALERLHSDDSDIDPNGAYRDGLSEAQQQAYDHALEGDVRHDIEQRTLPWDKRGCSGKADHTFHPEQEGPQPAIIDDVSAFRSNMYSDPALVALDEEMNVCMAKAGFTPDVAAASFEDIEAYLEAHPSATADDPGVIKLKKQEIAMTLAGLDCADEVDYATRSSAIIIDLENAYIKKHKKELEEAQLWINGK